MALEGGEGSASPPGRFLPPEKTRYPLYRRLGGTQGRSGQVRKILPHRDSIPGPSNPQPVATPTTLPDPLPKLSSLIFLALHFTRVKVRSGVHSHSGDHKVSSLGYSLQLYHRVQHRPTVNRNVRQQSPVHNPPSFILTVECGVRPLHPTYL